MQLILEKQLTSYVKTAVNEMNSHQIKHNDKYSR